MAFFTLLRGENMVNLFNLDIKQITHDGSIVVLMKLNGDVVYEYEGVIEYPYVEYTVDRNSTDPLNQLIMENSQETYYYSLPKTYTSNSPSYDNYNFDYKKVEITLLDGTITDDITTACNLIDKVKIWFTQRTYCIDFMACPDYEPSFHTNLTGLVYCDISNIKSLKNMFFGCNKLESLDVSYWNTRKITDMSGTFAYCNKLTSLDVSGFDTSNAVSMNHMFLNCELLTTLDVSNFDTSNVTDMSGMFNGCTNLTTLDVSNFDASNVTDIGYMFDSCRKLTSLDCSNWNISNIESMRCTFDSCYALTSLDCSSWDVSEVWTFTDAFYGLTKLVDFYPPKNINSSIGFGSCLKLSHDSLMRIINNLMTVTSTKTLTLGTTNLAKLTDEEKAIATGKGWTVK